MPVLEKPETLGLNKIIKIRVDKIKICRGSIVRNRVVPDIRHFFISGIRQDIRFIRRISGYKNCLKSKIVLTNKIILIYNRDL